MLMHNGNWQQYKKNLKVWVIFTLTASIIFAVLFFLVCCLCWERRKKVPQFYVLEEGQSKNGSQDFFRNSMNNLMLFRRFSAINEPEGIFTSKSLPFFNVKNRTKGESDLLDSMEERKSFDNLILQFEENDENSVAPKDDLRSCISTDSMNTFYSTHPSLVRTNSRSSFVSIISDSDLETLIS